jgi:hypothetical protein
MSHRALLPVFATLLVGCSYAGIREPSGWISVQTRHFRVRTGYHHSGWKRRLADLEEAYAGLRSSFFRKATIGQIDVLVLEENDFEETFGPNQNAVALATAPGGGFGANGLLVISTDLEDPMSGLSHMFVQAIMPGAPHWFHEGLAYYVRTAAFRKIEGRPVACLGIPRFLDISVDVDINTLVHSSVTHYRFRWERPGSIALRDLFARSWDEYNGKERSSYANTARALIDYIAHGDGGVYVERIGPILSQVSRGAPSAEVVTAAFGGISVDQLGQRVRAHDNALLAASVQSKNPRGLCPLGFPIVPEHLPDEDPKGNDGVPTDEMKVLLEWLLRLPRAERGFPRWYPGETLARIR